MVENNAGKIAIKIRIKRLCLSVSFTPAGKLCQPKVGLAYIFVIRMLGKVGGCLVPVRIEQAKKSV